MNKELFDSGHHKILIDVQKKTHYHLDFKENSQGSLVLELQGEGELKLDITLQAGSQWNILSLNESSKKLTIKEVIILLESASLNMSYSELSYGSHTKDTTINFLGEKSTLELNAAILVFKKLDWDIIAHHQAKKTYANVNNQAIVLNDAFLNLDIIGKIDNGNSGSGTHQLSRIMNMGDGLNTIVHPQLLIEENDVEASHAASVGQANEEHIYYLQSRGLSRDEALKLIVLGYLLPVIQFIPQKETRELLEKEIERKVMEAWTL